MDKYKNTSSYQGGWKNEYLTFSDSVVSEKGAIYEIWQAHGGLHGRTNNLCDQK